MSTTTSSSLLALEGATTPARTTPSLLVQGDHALTLAAACRSSATAASQRRSTSERSERPIRAIGPTAGASHSPNGHCDVAPSAGRVFASTNTSHLLKPTGVAAMRPGPAARSRVAETTGARPNEKSCPRRPGCCSAADPEETSRDRPRQPALLNSGRVSSVATPSRAKPPVTGIAARRHG